jgi:excinuclease UvrABC ATPase subunit
LPPLKKTEKHDIDVVIDRVKVRPDTEPQARDQLRQRLAESFEAALRVAGGRAIALEIDSNPATEASPQPKEHLFNAKFSCPACSYSTEDIKFSYMMDSGTSQGKKVSKKHPFEGIVPNMQRRYKETDSALVREDLARYRSTQPCTECSGTRLRREARHVKIGEGEQARAIYEISHATLRNAFTACSTCPTSRLRPMLCCMSSTGTTSPTPRA